MKISFTRCQLHCTVYVVSNLVRALQIVLFAVKPLTMTDTRAKFEMNICCTEVLAVEILKRARRDFSQLYILKCPL